MELSEYIKSRNEVVEPERRYNIYRHVQYRMMERFGIPRSHFPMAEWERMSYGCASRQVEALHRQGQTVFFVCEYHGRGIIWVYSREFRCIMTVYMADDNMYQMKYKDEERRFRYKQGRVAM
jgi:hypothetical protein